MSKRKRNDSEETVTEENALISVTNNKIMFYSDVEPPSVFKLIKAIDEATKYVNSINSNMLDNDIPIYLHIGFLNQL